MFDIVNSNGGVSIAVSNAVDSIKFSSKYITNSVTQDGFLVAVEKIIKNNEKIVAKNQLLNMQS